MTPPWQKPKKPPSTKEEHIQDCQSRFENWINPTQSLSQQAHYDLVEKVRNIAQEKHLEESIHTFAKILFFKLLQNFHECSAKDIYETLLTDENLLFSYALSEKQIREALQLDELAAQATIIPRIPNAIEGKNAAAQHIPYEESDHNEDGQLEIIRKNYCHLFVARRADFIKRAYETGLAFPKDEEAKNYFETLLHLLHNPKVKIDEKMLHFVTSLTLIKSFKKMKTHIDQML